MDDKDIDVLVFFAPKFVVKSREILDKLNEDRVEVLRSRFKELSN